MGFNKRKIKGRLKKERGIAKNKEVNKIFRRHNKRAGKRF
jgi:hypothetical protein